MALVPAYGLLAAMGFGSALFGPTIVAVLPFIVAYGLGVLPFVHGRVSEPPMCTACDKAILPSPRASSLPARAPSMPTARAA